MTRSAAKSAPASKIATTPLNKKDHPAGTIVVIINTMFPAIDAIEYKVSAYRGPLVRLIAQNNPNHVHIRWVVLDRFNRENGVVSVYKSPS